MHGASILHNPCTFLKKHVCSPPAQILQQQFSAAVIFAWQHFELDISHTWNFTSSLSRRLTQSLVTSRLYKSMQCLLHSVIFFSWFTLTLVAMITKISKKNSYAQVALNLKFHNPSNAFLPLRGIRILIRTAKYLSQYEKVGANNRQKRIKAYNMGVVWIVISKLFTFSLDISGEENVSTLLYVAIQFRFVSFDTHHLIALCVCVDVWWNRISYLNALKNWNTLCISVAKHTFARQTQTWKWASSNWFQIYESKTSKALLKATLNNCLWNSSTL